MKQINLRIRSLMLVFGFSITVSNLFGQVSLTTSPYTENFDGIGSGYPTGWTGRTGANSTTLGTAASLTTAHTNWTSTAGNFHNSASQETTDVSGSADRVLAVRQSGSFGDPGVAFVLQLANTSGKTSFNLSFKLQQLHATTAGRTTTWIVDYGIGASPSSFSTATTNPVTLTTVQGTSSNVSVTVNFGTALDNKAENVWIRITSLTASTGSGSRAHTAIDDVELSWSASASPTIFTSTASLTGFSAVTGNNSSSQNFTVRATNATEKVILTAPTGYQLSRNDATFQDTVHTTFVVDSVPTQTIYVRQTSATLGATSGNISCTTPSATTVNISLSGVVYSTQPGTQPSLTVGAITSSTIELTVGNTGGLNNWIVLAKEGSAVDGVPADGTDYTPNATFSSGATIATNNRVVLKGNGTSVTVTLPNPGTAYHFAVYAYNDGGVTASTNYNENSPGTANATTSTVPLGWQINSTNTLFTINFDSTVANINNGAFTAASTFGAANPVAGQLNSNAWSYTANAGGAASFGGNLASGFGASTGGVTSSGVFAFEVASGNVALGIQPTGTVFSTGGNLTLRIQNKTGATLNNVQLSYLLWVNNNEARSTTMGFSHSTDNSTYTAVSDASYSSTLASQGNNTWIAQYISASLSSLNIANDGFLYIRWTGTDNGGSGSRDEFAIDDIRLIAERSSTNLTASGNFENMLVDGNLNLPSSTNVSGILNIKSGVLTTNNNLTLTSSAASSTAQVTGGTNASITGNVNVQRFLPWASANNNGFRFVSHPLRSNPQLSAITNLPAGFNTVIGYDEDFSITQGGYIGLNDRTVTLGQAKSIGVWTNAANTLSFSGELQLDAIASVSVDFAGTSTGWNFMGNPFPNALDWDEVTKSSTVNNATYMWIKDNLASGGGTWGTYINGTAANGGSRYLAVGQGFVVKATGSSPAPSLGFPLASRVSGQNPTYNVTTSLPDELRLRVNRWDNGTRFETVVKFAQDATEDFDPTYDAELMSDGRVHTPDLYTIDAQGGKYTIQTLPMPTGEHQVLPLQLETFGAGSFSFDVDLSKLRAVNKVELQDTKLNTFTTLVNNSQYVFTTDTNDAIARFVLHFNRAERTHSTVSVDENIFDQVNVYSYENEIFVRGMERADQFRILDLTGRVVYELNQPDFTAGTIRPHLAAGTYLVNLSKNGAVKTVKVVLQ